MSEDNNPDATQTAPAPSPAQAVIPRDPPQHDPGAAIRSALGELQSAHDATETRLDQLERKVSDTLAKPDVASETAGLVQEIVNFLHWLFPRPVTGPVEGAPAEERRYPPGNPVHPSQGG